MDLVARRREVHDDRTKVPPGHTSIAPGSFNEDATLGRSAVIKWNPTAEDTIAGILQAVNVAFWQGIKKEAQAMTVDVSLGFLPTLQLGDAPTSPINTRPYAEVEYGSDGNRTKVKFDVGFGKRITVVGNYIAVSVAMGPPRPGFNDPVQITAGASIGAFAAPSPSPVILTEYVDLLAPGAITPLIPIPLRGVQLLPVQTNMPIGEILELRWFDYGGNNVATSLYQQANNAAMAPIPVTGDIGFVRVFSPGTNVFTAEVRLPFQLAL
jgi:hypothetical protein